jgi:hypothetical protein
MAASTDKTNKPLIPRGVDDRPVDKYNRAALYSGKALDFDGVNDSIDISDFSLNGYTAFSICFYKLTDTSASRWVFGNSDSISDGINVYQNADGTIRSRINALNFDTTNNHFKTNGFFVFTYNGTKGDWFVNGQSESTTTQSAQTLSITSGAKIAVPSYTTGSYYDGQIANFKIFNTALTAAQVADLYNNPEKVVPTGVDNTALKLWLPMQEGAGTTAYDGSGNGNHGTISGATWTHGIGAPVSQTAVIDWNKGTNYVDYSNDFTQSSWTTARATLTSGQSGVLGSSDAWKIESNATGFTGGYDNTTSLNAVNCSSIYAKAGNIDYLFIASTQGSTNNAQYFNLTTGTLGSLVGSGITSADIEDVGDGWYRCSVVMSANASFGYMLFGLANTDGNNGSVSGEYIYVQNAQLNEGSSVGVYTTTIGTPQTSPVLLPQGLTSGRDITGVNLFENVRKQGALNLDGNSWAEVHDNESLDVTTGVSLECWFYKDEQTTQSGLLAKWGSTTGVDRCYMLMIGADSKIRFYTNSDAGIDTSVLADGWNHIVGTYDKTTSIRKLYVNAVEKDSDAFSADLVVSDKPIEIGRYNYTTQYQLPNQIAQTRIYNRALTASEVLNNYNATSSLYI